MPHIVCYVYEFVAVVIIIRQVIYHDSVRGVVSLSVSLQGKQIAVQVVAVFGAVGIRSRYCQSRYLIIGGRKPVLGVVAVPVAALDVVCGGAPSRLGDVAVVQRLHLPVDGVANNIVAYLKGK